MDLRALLHNKPALIGLGVAGAAGLFVLLKRKQATGSSASDTGSTATGTTATLPAYPDTTGTNVASWLGSQEGVLAAQNQQFLDQLQQTIGASGSTSSSSSSSGTGSTVGPYPRIVPVPPRIAIRPVRPATGF